MKIFDIDSVEYETEVSPQGIIKTQAIWTIPDFMELLLKDIGLGNSTVILSSIHKFAFAIWHRDKCVYIFIKPTTTQTLESVELKTFLNNNNLVEESIAKEERLIITKDRRHLLASLFIDCGLHNDLEYNYSHKHLFAKKNNKITKCFLPNGSLHVKFEFVIKTEDDCIISSPQLNDVLKNILHEGTHYDVVIKSVEGDEFKVHKALLAGRSPVLKANFDHNFSESVTNIVESHLESAVLQETLSFIYTDQAKVDEMPEKLLAAADYYQLDRLRSLCEKALLKNLTVDNAIETLLLADLHSANALTKQTLDFIKQDKEQLKLITKTEGWAKLKIENIDLLKRIIE